MQRSKNDLWVGLFVMLGAVALVFLALQSANLLTLQFHSGYRITAKFDNIGGLKARAPVKVAGVLVGYGTRMANGCTSGHGVCGLARLSPRSLVAVLVFMGSAMLTVALLRHLPGGVS